MMRVVAPPGMKEILYGEPPFGWRLSRDRLKLVRDRDEQRVIAVVRHMYFIGRIPMREVAAQLRALGVVNRRGRPFGLSRIFEIIHGGRRATAA
jgi:ribosomal protein S14